MPRKSAKQYTADDFGLDVLSGDMDMFRWFLLCLLFGKPIQHSVASATWQLLIDKNIDTPWAISEIATRKLVKILHSGGYTRYQYVTAHGLKVCADQIIRMYDGSLHYLIQSCVDEDECSKALQKLYGVGPKVAQIFMRETEELFARRAE